MPETKGLSLEEMDVMSNLDGVAHGMRTKTDRIIEERRETGQGAALAAEKPVALYVEEV